MLQVPQYENNERVRKLFEDDYNDANDAAVEQTIENVDIIFYDVKDVARMLHCSVPTAREIMYRADFPAIKIKKLFRVSKPAFEAWAMERRV